MMRITEAVKQLIIINILVYVCSQFVPVAYGLLSLHFPINPDFQFWQVFSYMFMHAPYNEPPGITHILFNMLALYMFGSPLEERWGAKKFVFFYLSCGVGAGLISLGIDYLVFNDIVNTLTASGISKSEIISLMSEGKYNTQWQEVLSARQFQNFATLYGNTVGASGALYGITVAFAFMYPNAEMRLLFFPIPVKAKYFVPLLLGFDLFMGLRGQAVLGQGDGVAHFAHLGGALVGFIMMWYWKKNSFNQNRWN